MNIKDFIQGKQWKKWDKSQWTIVVLAGILLLIIALPTGSSKKEESVKEPAKTAVQTAKQENVTEDYASLVEQKLSQTLSKIEGAGKVEVMVTLKDNGESVVEKDVTQDTTGTSEKDSAGGTREENQRSSSQSTVYAEKENEKNPFVEKEVTPRIEGVLVVAAGGNNTAVKQNISDAVMALFPVEAHRIKIVKMNVQEEGY